MLKHKGTLYIAGGGGLYSITKNRYKHLIKGVFVTGLVKNGDTVLAAAQNGKVYKFYNEELYKTISLPITPRKKTLCYGLAIDGKQRTWVGSWKGIYVLDKSDELLAFVSLKNLSEKDDAKIIDLHIDSKDRLWTTTSAHGIYKIDNFLESDPGGIQHKMISYKREAGNPKSLTSNIIMNYEEDNKNQMWFGSDIGIVSYNESSDDFDRLRYQGKLFDKKIMTLKKDGADNLWITTINDGIYVYNLEEKTFRHFTKTDGLISNAFLFGSGYYDHTEKMMYFGTDEGVQQIDLSKPFEEKQIAPPVVTHFKVNSTDGKSTIPAYSAPHLKTISLAPDQNDFSISFSALDFTNPEKLQYAYALDDGPFKIADLQTAYFTNVPFGNHRLKVQTLYDGIIQEQGVSCLSIYINPLGTSAIWPSSSICYL
ncbi:hypothetical protein [Maribacter halichondriae]|uniref:hypothetical protein n=1 Tax=Maribacter halichondriae TaxID=2980554 RepID=UPI0023598DFF|nr:hypothetical protein [Maribacter sp. Hal144]